MKKLVLFTGIIVYVLFAISAFIATASDNNPEPVNIVSTEVTEQTQSDTHMSYILKNHNGKIAVFDEAEEKVIETTDTQVSILPKEDQKRLNEGLYIEGSENLRRVLEDFCS